MWSSNFCLNEKRILGRHIIIIISLFQSGDTFGVIVLINFSKRLCYTIHFLINISYSEFRVPSFQWLHRFFIKNEITHTVLSKFIEKKCDILSAF